MTTFPNSFLDMVPAPGSLCQAVRLGNRKLSFTSVPYAVYSKQREKFNIAVFEHGEPFVFLDCKRLDEFPVETEYFTCSCLYKGRVVYFAGAGEHMHDLFFVVKI